MDNELVTTQKGIDKLPKPEIGFEFLQLPPHAENMKEEIEKRAGDALSILGKMGLQFTQKILLTMVNDSNFIDMAYSSRSSYQDDCINLVRIAGFVDLEKDNNGKWRDKIIIPIEYFMDLPEKVHSLAVLVHELAHVWMFQETQFGKEISPIRERIVEQRHKDHDHKRKVVIAFGEINSEFHDIVSDTSFRSLSNYEQFDAVELSLNDSLKEAGDVYDILLELFSQEHTINAIKKGNKQVKIALQKQEYSLKINHDFIESIESTNSYTGKHINQLEKEKEGKSKDEKLFVDVLIHIAKNERDNKIRSLKIERLFLEKGCHQFYTRTHTLITKIKQGSNVHDEAVKLKKDLVNTMKQIISLLDVMKVYRYEWSMVSVDESQLYRNLNLFREGFSRFVEEKFIDEYRRRNPDASTVLSNDKVNTDEFLDLTNTKLLPYIKGLALFKSKYTTVLETMDAIRAMSIEQIQKEFLS